MPELVSPTIDLPVSLSKLPPFPRVALRVLKALSDEDTPIKAIEDLIASDVVFASSALHCANSALFGLSARVLTVRHAIVVLGRDRLRSLILTTALQSFAKAPLRSKEFRAWWRHSLATALLSEALAYASHLNCPEAYMAGLLHDVGRLALILQLSRENWRLFERTVEGQSSTGKSILEIEREIFSVDHCQLGERLLVEWGMPQELIHPARHHHDPAAAASSNPALYTAVSCEISSQLGFASFNYPRSIAVADLLPLLPDDTRPMLATDPEKLRDALETKIRSLDAK